MYAAFDFPRHPLSREDGERLRGAFLRPPARWLRAFALSEVVDVLDQAWRASLNGAWVLGGVRYEAAAAFDAALVTQGWPDRPLAEFAVFEQAPTEWPAAVTPDRALNSDWLDAQAEAAELQQIERIREWIRSGDCYQVNLTTRLDSLLAEGATAWQLFRALHAAQPGGFSLFLQDGERAVASVSPELFFDWRPSSAQGESAGSQDWQLAAQPMKGTAPRGRDVVEDEARQQYLRTSVKERAENLMIVDLLRNDMGRLARLGSVRVARLFELHALSTVWQMTSTVTAHTPATTTLAQVFAALFPCGSVTGAPKVRAMQIIHELEPGPRGFYCGALGLLRPGGTATFNVPIRTVELDAGRLQCGIGSAITLDSDPAAEVGEWRAKSRFLLRAQAPIAALETLRLQEGEYPRLDGHLQRLRRTARHFGLALDLAEVRAALQRLAQGKPEGNWRTRLTVAADGAIGLQATPLAETPPVVMLALAAQPMASHGPAAEFLQHKTTRRELYDALLALKPPEAFDLILWNTDGELTECAIGNLALLRAGQWLTPRAEAGLLPGVYREQLLAEGRIVEARLMKDDLALAEGLAFFNSLRGWCPAKLL
ncbi:chorismate-binding protein [Roseateles toxinivorans]|uniref:Para-aminobenzoate synthetase/4-amino-4-deoxychorismate lyase n=1 Tax=Roseateles toxinivorans TaxID=270368 RepID=A0A4R6QHW2_9BURK|nr:bifunctional anthranilate synthase component I family protein/class IV aminotransferase [Roseateles toxinivorans]TDP63050.1 para-aminobenzoate synthetase/4-amino-4-deoxychorismate lyase [Roseateles toxinivorans]